MKFAEKLSENCREKKIILKIAFWWKILRKTFSKNLVKSSILKIIGFFLNKQKLQKKKKPFKISKNPLKSSKQRKFTGKYIKFPKIIETEGKNRKKTRYHVLVLCTFSALDVLLDTLSLNKMMKIME